MRGNSDNQAPSRGISLHVAIAALRDELTRAWWDGQHRTVRFKPSRVELTLQVAVTKSSNANAGVDWWLIELDAGASKHSVTTQTIKLTLEPSFVDPTTGQQGEVLIDTGVYTKRREEDHEISLEDAE